MNIRVRVLSVIAPLLLAACASSPPPPVAAATPPGSADTSAATGAATDAHRPPPPPGQKRYKWTKASEAEVAAALDKKFQEAAKPYVELKRHNQSMFCKKTREMGSRIRTLPCITEAGLRKQVEDSDELREQMRNKVGKCVMGRAVPCGGN